MDEKGIRYYGVVPDGKGGLRISDEDVKKRIADVFSFWAADILLEDVLWMPDLPMKRGKGYIREPIRVVFSIKGKVYETDFEYLYRRFDLEKEEERW